MGTFLGCFRGIGEIEEEGELYQKCNIYFVFPLFGTIHTHTHTDTPSKQSHTVNIWFLSPDFPITYVITTEVGAKIKKPNPDIYFGTSQNANKTDLQPFKYFLSAR